MSLGIPYMGSKRKIAPEILKLITSRHECITDFYDLFGGGGAISFNAVNDYRFNVHYNELNSHIYELVKYLKENKTLEPKFYEWANDNPHPVYISEYAAPFQMVDMFSHRSSLSATNNKKKVIESIFWNGKGEVYETKLFSL